MQCFGPQWQHFDLLYIALTDPAQMDWLFVQLYNQHGTGCVRFCLAVCVALVQHQCRLFVFEVLGSLVSCPILRWEPPNFG